MNDRTGPPASSLGLKLYVAGMTERSLQAIETIRGICESEVGGKFDLQIIDIYQNPQVALNDQIIAVPTLVRFQPEPIKVMIGDLSNQEKVRNVLGFSGRPKAGAEGRV